MLDLFVIPVLFGLVGFLTPCSLGVNFIFLAYINGKERAARLKLAITFTLARAVFLSTLGILFALIGQQIVGFEFIYRKAIGLLFVVLGGLFIMNKFGYISFPGAKFLNYFRQGTGGSAATLGILFGLDIPACSTPLLIYLLGRTVLQGEVFFGAISLMVFGIAMSLPLVLISFFEGSNNFITRVSRGSGALSYGAGILLMLLGLATFSPRAMALAGTFFVWAAGMPQ